MVSNLAWGVLSTTSTRSEGTSPGTAFGNPYSYADVDGVPYIYASDLDASMVDVFAKNATVGAASLALSEAALKELDGSATQPSCDIKNVQALGDPENPPCARLVLSGAVSKVAVGTDEESRAKEALFARHPSFKHYPSGHSFYVAKLSLTGIWLINMFGACGPPLIPACLLRPTLRCLLGFM